MSVVLNQLKLDCLINKGVDESSISPVKHSFKIRQISLSSTEKNGFLDTLYMLVKRVVLIDSIFRLSFHFFCFIFLQVHHGSRKCKPMITTPCAKKIL